MQRTSQAHSRNTMPADTGRHERNVIACVDRSEHAAKIVPHAIAIANALGLPVTLLQVLEMQSAGDLRPDPIEWDLRRQEARNALKRLADARGDDAERIEAELVDGQTADEICRWTREQAVDLIVLGTHGERGTGACDLGSTARSVLQRAAGSVLLVPVSVPQTKAPRYRRILIPVDGSSWGESAFPLALRLARAVGAELLLAHVVPVPELTQTGPLEAADLQLRERVVERNERVARAYVERLRGYAAAQGLRVRALMIRGEDVRSSLARIVSAEGADLVVLSARGHGGNRPSDAAYGSVAAYLMTHSATPMLIVRPPVASNAAHEPERRENSWTSGAAA